MVCFAEFSEQKSGISFNQYTKKTLLNKLRNAPKLNTNEINII